MDYNLLLDLATDLGYELAMSGAETFRVEDSIQHILSSYHIKADVFAIPNYLVVSIITDSGKPITRMRRIGYHGNNLDSVEKLNALSRKICQLTPNPSDAIIWLQDVLSSVKKYNFLTGLLGDFMGAFGFSILFGCRPIEILFAGLCGIIIGLVNKFMEYFKANPLFSTFAASFCMSLTSYILLVTNLIGNADSINIGALMLLVPGLLFTNGLRDIIYGDTNSGINRIVQVVLIAVSLAMGTAFAWNAVGRFSIIPESAAAQIYALPITCIGTLIGCLGFSILFNIHGPGTLLCAFGGAITWVIFSVSLTNGCSELSAYFWGTCFASLYAEIMARVRKYPTISYLVVSIFPLIPGAGVYYSMQHALNGNMALFATQGMHTAAIAGTMAISILFVSTSVRLYFTWHNMKRK